MDGPQEDLAVPLVNSCQFYGVPDKEVVALAKLFWFSVRVVIPLI